MCKRFVKMCKKYKKSERKVRKSRKIKKRLKKYVKMVPDKFFLKNYEENIFRKKFTIFKKSKKAQNALEKIIKN